MGNYSTSRAVRHWHVLAQMITGVPYMAYIVHVVTGVHSSTVHIIRIFILDDKIRTIRVLLKFR